MVSRDSASDLTVCSHATPGPWHAHFWDGESSGIDNVFCEDVTKANEGYVLRHIADQPLYIDPTATEDYEGDGCMIVPDTTQSIAMFREINRGYDAFTGVANDPENVYLRPGDAAFIAMARDALPYWIYEAERLRKIVELRDQWPDLRTTSERPAEIAAPQQS